MCDGGRCFDWLPIWTGRGRCSGLLERPAADYLLEHRRRRIAVRGLDAAQIEAQLVEHAGAQQQAISQRVMRCASRFGELGVEVMDTPTGTPLAGAGLNGRSMPRWF